MDHPEPHADIAERNLERLLNSAYRPEAADPHFVQSVTEYLCDVAKEEAAKRTPAAPATQQSPAEDPRLRRLRRRFGWGMAIAASIFLSVLFLYGTNRTDPPQDPPQAKGLLPPAGAPAPVQAVYEPIGQTAQPRPTTDAPKPVAVGETLTTKPGERRRVLLADGSLLYLNQNTSVMQIGERRLELTRGEVYVEVTPRPDQRFVVKTSARDVTGLGTRFGVRSAEDE